MRQDHSVANIVLALLTMTVSNITAACACLYGGEFLEYAKTKPVVVRGLIDHGDSEARVNSGLLASIDVIVVEVVKGNFSHGLLKLTGGDGLSCAKRISRADYPQGSEHFFILNDSNEFQTLLGCGEVSVKVVNSTIEGQYPVVGGVSNYEMSLSEFKAALEYKDDI